MAMMRTLPSSWGFAIGLLTTLLIGAPAAAQNTGIISGTVIDNTAQLVPGATVTLINEATADARTTTSGGDGTFAFRAVEPGSYTVKVELTGFRTLERRKNVLNVSGQLDVGSLKLDVGTLSEVVSVVAEGATIETRNSDYSGLLTATQISQIQSPVSTTRRTSKRSATASDRRSPTSAACASTGTRSPSTA
jgi:Carboxypeptidase regulatory-like domain